MCGICGIVTVGAPPDLDLLNRMMDRQRHRGPDGHGYFRDRRAALGHTRLAIVDVTGGAQPLCNEDGNLWVSFNGQIFNYVELGEELRALGHTFRTVSDTEVIVHAWEQWGENAFARFNGQWAIALWDRRKEQLILSRDRLGVRPLYFARNRDRLVFASEIKAILVDPTVPRAFDPTGLDETFTYWSTVAPRTVFSGIEQLEPGHYAIFDRDGFLKAPYWSIDFPGRWQEPQQDINVNADELRDRLIEATRLRFLRSDVPVGAYLSGGIDSSVTASVIARYTDAPLHTFSLRFADAQFDEGSYQQTMAELLGTKHESVVVSASDIAAVFPEVVWHAEVPILRAAPAPMFLLSRFVRDNGFKVVVTGEGADEVLGGYDIYREAQVRQFWSRDPDSQLRSRAAALLYPWMSRSPGQTPAFARSFFGRNLDPQDPAVSHRPRWDSTGALRTMLSSAMRQEGEHFSADDFVASMPGGSEDWDPLSRAQWFEMKTLLPGYILASQGDRMLMANSVEGRFPFLDRDVVELANALPARHKLFGLNEKHLLKLSFSDLIPAEIRNRPKQPYRAPDAASFFFAGRTPEWLDDVTSPEAIRACEVFDESQVGALFAKCRRRGGAGMSNTDNMRALAVISTQLTYQQFIVDAGAGGAARADSPLQVAVDLVNENGSTS